MVESWIISKISPLKPAPMIILRDPQRMIQAGAHAVDGWADENGYTVLFCSGNLALREMSEMAKEARNTLLVDRSRTDAKTPLFYPDLFAKAPPRCRIHLSLRAFLIEKTGDAHWPPTVDQRNISRILLENLDDTLEAHKNLRQVDSTRFSDSDLYKIALGAALKINPFKILSPSDIRRMCIEQHQTLEELKQVLPEDVMNTLQESIHKAPKPFCWLLERDPEAILRAFTLSAIMHQHQLDYRLLLSNIDPSLHTFRDIEEAFLDQAMQDQLTINPGRAIQDVQEAETYLLADPERIAFLLSEKLHLNQPQQAFSVLKHERLSPLIRGMALVSLLLDLVDTQNLSFHSKVLAEIEKQTQEAIFPVFRRPTETWINLLETYRRALDVYSLTDKLADYAKTFQVTPADHLDFDVFERLWNHDRMNRLDYYLSDLDRMLRVGGMLPTRKENFWPQLTVRWETARKKLAEVIDAVRQVMVVIDSRFQDVYRLHYTRWIQDENAPVLFTHQFLPRLFQRFWDPKSKQKAYIMVFDGLRTDAWDELLRPVFEERFTIIASRPGSALLPTETKLSRKAISAGNLPINFTSQNELELFARWLKDQMGQSIRFEVVCNDDTTASGMTVRYVSPKLEYIVFNFTDKNLHHNDQDLAFIYNTTVREIIRQDVRSVIRELPDDALIFITSDHGFMPVVSNPLEVPVDVVVDPGDVKYRNARSVKRMEGKDADKVVTFDVRVMGIPATSPSVSNTPYHYVLFPRPGKTFRRPRGRFEPDRYTHGGLSLAECMVPMVVMGPKQVKQLPLRINSLRQVGSVSEGEPLTLELQLSPTQIGLEELAIAISFSQEEIPTRREIFTGRPTSYTIQWTPKLGDISDVEREQGQVVIPVTTIVSFRQGQETARISQVVDARIKLDSTRLRRRIDSKLDFLMGKRPKGLDS